jgi:hypothetical protein
LNEAGAGGRLLIVSDAIVRHRIAAALPRRARRPHDARWLRLLP